jgi:hypothetical protein
MRSASIGRPFTFPTMKISHQTVARLPRGYSIAVFPGFDAAGRSAFLAGSEGDAELLWFEPPWTKAKVIARTPGGFISVAPLSIGPRRFAVASTLFKPGFDAAASAIQLYPLERGPEPKPQLVATLPYTHRIATSRIGDRDVVLASTLCGGKKTKEDWTQPGGIYVAEVPAQPGGDWAIRPVIQGLNKNHGFEFARLGAEGREGYLVSAMEGLFFLPLPRHPGDAWSLETIDRVETSDAFAYDWDNDGEPEIFSIAPFHGHRLSVYKRGADGWHRTTIHHDLAMGHVVWAGDFLGRPGLLAGSRRERRELRLYRPTVDGGVDPHYTVIDEGIGPSQLVVTCPTRDRALLYVAAHGIDEVRVYDVRER